MEKIINALKALEPCTSRELAKQLDRDVAELLPELLELQDRWKIYCVNGFWRVRVQTKSPERIAA
ncbi:hypothetical protein [Klebsiella aerogenes]|uniref:hypothetical protein n=1 Tax=Klebsiella aerogenes TaxID=548 RepID=UPI00351D4AB5